MKSTRLTYLVSLAVLLLLYIIHNGEARAQTDTAATSADSAYIQEAPVPNITLDWQKALELEQAKNTRIIRQIWFLSVWALLLICYIAIREWKYHRKSSEPASPANIPNAPAKRPSAMNDQELFQYMSEIIRNEQLFLNPMLDRQTIINRLGGMSAHRIGAAFSKGSEYGSLPGFIRSLRLEHACRLLTGYPDMSVKAVGEASGFSNNSTFCSDFKTSFGITPSEYRQANSRK